MANWDTINGADRYKVHYRILGDTSWLNLAFIYPPNNSVTIPLLQQSTTYEWQIMTYHDNTNLASSMWSMSDTFTTSLFVPAPFNPNVTNTIGSVQCNVPTELTLEITQQSNEPDIGTSEITSTGGYFNLGMFSMGDSVGYAIMNNNNQLVESTLRFGISLSSLAIINSFDTSGSLLGFFTIENTATGIKVSTTSPNDGNNYTSGYSSEVSFTNIFVTPPNSGPLYFFIDIESELSDQIIQTDTIQIYCNTSLQEEMMSKKVIKTYSLLGKKIYGIKNGVDINLHKDGSVKKVIKIK